MTTENTDSTETLVKKTRKPRSPNKPKTVDKLALLASRQVDRLNAKREEALAQAADRVNKRFDEKIAEFVASLDEAVRPLVTGLNQGVTAVEANKAEAAE